MDEKGEGLARGLVVALEALHRAGQAVETAGDGPLGLVRAVGRKERRDRRFDVPGGRNTAPCGERPEVAGLGAYAHRTESHDDHATSPSAPHLTLVSDKEARDRLCRTEGTVKDEREAAQRRAGVRRSSAEAMAVYACQVRERSKLCACGSQIALPWGRRHARGMPPAWRCAAAFGLCSARASFRPSAVGSVPSSGTGQLLNLWRAGRAKRRALERAGRQGEAPDIVWLTAAPGREESVLQGIKDIAGSPALIVGGSSADNDVVGRWTQLSGDGAATDSVVVSVLFPSTPFGCSFESGYGSTKSRGTVTEVSDRTVARIDHRPAAEVYAEWTGGQVELPAQGSASSLVQATMFPLGRQSTRIGDVPFHIMAHPRMKSMLRREKCIDLMFRTLMASIEIAK